MLEGGCFCGAIRYVAGGTARDQTNCHCSICRRLSGAPFVAWFTIPADGYRLVAGQPSLLRSSEQGTRTFCSQCGTPLTFQRADAMNEVDVTVGSLDHPELAPPRDDTHVASMVPWVRLDPALPSYPTSRAPGVAEGPGDG